MLNGSQRSGMSCIFNDNWVHFTCRIAFASTPVRRNPGTVWWNLLKSCSIKVGQAESSSSMRRAASASYVAVKMNRKNYCRIILMIFNKKMKFIAWNVAEMRGCRSNKFIKFSLTVVKRDCLNLIVKLCKFIRQIEFFFMTGKMLRFSALISIEIMQNALNISS